VHTFYENSGESCSAEEMPPEQAPRSFPTPDPDRGPVVVPSPASILEPRTRTPRRCVPGDPNSDDKRRPMLPALFRTVRAGQTFSERQARSALYV
ncbi:hypothetical protein IscW_ISCW023030, partial [Ixodes scapularis]